MAYQIITWGSFVNCAETPAGTITKNAGGSNWNASATAGAVLEGDGGIRQTHDSAGFYAFGLTTSRISGSYTALNYAWMHNSLGNWEIWENNSSKGSFGAAVTDDVAEIKREGSTIKYYLNGVLKYTSLTSNSDPLFGDFSIFTVGGKVTDIEMDGVILIPIYIAGQGTGHQTNFNLTIPAETLTDDVLIAAVGTINATGMSLSDNDTTGNNWQKFADVAYNDVTWGDFRVSLWRKRATAGSAGKTITVIGGTSASSGLVSVYRHCRWTANPIENVQSTQLPNGTTFVSGFTPSAPYSMLMFVTFYSSNLTIPNPETASTGVIFRSKIGFLGEFSPNFVPKANIGHYSEIQNAEAATGNINWAVGVNSAVIVFNLLGAGVSEDEGEGEGAIKVWDGADWIPKPLKYWNGSEWLSKPLKYWNGSEWITLSTSGEETINIDDGTPASGNSTIYNDGTAASAGTFNFDDGVI